MRGKLLQASLNMLKFESHFMLEVIEASSVLHLVSEIKLSDVTK